MAPRNPNANGVRINGDALPPSTLAAQIVQNQTRAPATQPDGAAPSFAQILKDILHQPAAVAESDVEINVKLIGVVAEAGLGPITDGNPFAQWDVLIPQAKDSIAVIQATVLRQPGTLFTATEANGPQLLLPLFARLTAACGKPKCEEVPVCVLLESIFRVLEVSTDFWLSAQTLQSIVEACVEDALSALEAPASLSSSFAVKLPPARSIHSVWPRSQDLVALPQNCQTIIADPSQAFVLALQLCNIPGVRDAWRREMQQRLQRLAPCLQALLQGTKQWDLAVSMLISSSSNVLFLSHLLRDAGKGLPAASVQMHIADALMRTLLSKSNTIEDDLLPLLLTLASSERFDSIHEDLRIAMTATLGRFCASERLPERVHTLHATLCQDDSMTECDMLTHFKKLDVAPAKIVTSHRKKRRRRIEQVGAEQSKDFRCQTLSRVIKLLAGSESQDLSRVEFAAPDAYLTLTFEEKCNAWQALTDLAQFEPKVTLQTVSKLIDLPNVNEMKRPRVLSMLAIRACVEITSDPLYVDIHSSRFGQACLRSIHSSLRELRIAAGHCLKPFLRDDLPSDIKTRNRKVTLEYLRTLSDRNVASEQESLVNAWGQLASICSGSELNLAILCLIECLGDTNTLISDLAFLELETLEHTRAQSLMQMFKPFWNSIAPSVVQDLHARPQKAQQLCDLLGTDMNYFLVARQEDIVPVLVLGKKKAILQRVASARGKDTTVQDLCLQPKTNLAATLALLLMLPGPDTEVAVMECLTEVAPSFRETDLSTLIKLDPTLIACYMLKLISDQSDDRKSRAYRAFHQFANIAEKRPGQAKANTKSSRAVTEFFEMHILGMLTHFSSILDEAQGLVPVTEKVRCLRAINDMIHLNKSHISIALPQIRASLQSAMQRRELCETAISAWLDLVSVLDGDDVSGILEQSFALIIRHWDDVSPKMQQRIHQKVGQLIQTRNQVIQDMVMVIPSLETIPLLSKLAAELERLKSQNGTESHLKAFTKRLRDENAVVVLRALEELVPFLEANQSFMHDSAASEQPPVVLKELLRTLLDATSKHSPESAQAASLCGKALGFIGCLDPNRVEAARKQRKLLVLSNFDNADEVVQWTVAFLEDVLVKAFKSATSSRAQGFLSYTIQELLRFCDFNDSTVLRPRASQLASKQQRWLQLPEHVRITLTPFVTSRYLITSQTQITPPERKYPDFRPDVGHSHWLRGLVYDLMWKAKGDNPQMVFPLLARIIRGHDIGIASFVLPYAMLNVVLGGTVPEMQGITDEILAVLRYQAASATEQESIKLCSESIFSVLDYMSTWLHEKKKVLGDTRASAYRTGNSPNDFDEAKDMGQIDTIERFLASIPAEVIAAQAVTCGSYARALFNWEHYIRQQRPLIPSARPFQKGSRDEDLFERLQEIYAEIDEPDGLEGISAHLPFLNEDKEAIQHAKAGRWSAAQAWYEVQLTEQPHNVDIEDRLLGCLKETGRYAPLLRYADSFIASRREELEIQESKGRLLPVMAEAYWMTGDLDGMGSRVYSQLPGESKDFATELSIIIGDIVATKQDTEIMQQISNLRETVTQSMTFARTGSVQTCHDDLRKLHVLSEVETLVHAEPHAMDGLLGATATFERRLAAIGSYVSDKQYILGTRRAVMQCLPQTIHPLHIGASWLTSAKLARQTGNTEYAYSAVLKAYNCGSKGAKLEEARLLWRDGHQRHAIHSLESAIASGAFEIAQNDMESGRSTNTRSTDLGHPQNMLAARAHLLLAKWLDASGQSQTKDMTDKYQYASRHFQRWEKGHYYLGKHYQKLFEAEKALPKAKQSVAFHTGELVRLVIENQLRSVPFGNKYWHQTIPKILTLWLELGTQTLAKSRGEDQYVFDRRVKALTQCNKQLQKYFDRVPPYVFYSALPQMLSRITHVNPEIWKQLSSILSKIVSTHPSQALWGILAVTKSSDNVRLTRGTEIINRLKTKPKSDGAGVDLRAMIAQGQKLSDGLLQACEARVEARAANVSLSRDLAFSHKLAPSPLVVPIESTLTPSMPASANAESIRKHKAFVQDKVTIQSFADNVLVLSSLQRPRKITVRGSDGKQYGLLCKPKDDLRKDQRLMEFNSIINRVLKRDAESSKRRLYIKTYAVTPLSEESGTIEWVEGIKPIRDILLNSYARKGIRPNYTELRNILNEACQNPENAHLFVDRVLPIFPASLHEWFVEVYPEPDIWFAARVRYARTAAVMSITGHVLGLGDRHGENILLEESTGGVFHVDFNCLFDKGQTFEKPEVVPFRLTHNMVDAMGPCGYEGPFRKSSELTYRLLRQTKDTLMTVLETFVYDPTTDFVGRKKRTTPGVPETPQEILDGVDGKLKGLLKGETVPLSVEGYADALIREATSPFNLASMYIGWCAFL